MYLCIYIQRAVQTQTYNVSKMIHFRFYMFVTSHPSPWNSFQFNTLLEFVVGHWGRLTSLFSSIQSLGLDEGHAVRAHVRVQCGFCVKRFAAHPALCVWYVRGVLLLLGRHARHLLQPVDDEQVTGERIAWCVAQTALHALVGRTVSLVLREVLLEQTGLGAGETAHGASVRLQNGHLQLFYGLR